jgi:aryl-alcohol dehydrogenase-like predicted oxidoreductase
VKYLELFSNTQNAVRISQFALGCDHFGDAIPEEQAFRIMDAYYEQGGTLLDTAHVYSQRGVGEISLSEKTVGKQLFTRRLYGMTKR